MTGFGVFRSLLEADFHYNGTVIPVSNPDALLDIKAEVEDFLGAHANSVLVEDGAELMDLSRSTSRVSIEHGKLLFEAWNGARSIVRRVEEVAYRDQGRLGLFARRPAAREAGVLELRDGGSPAPAERAEARSAVRRDLTAYLQKCFPEWRLDRVSNRSDREHSFSAWYTRGLARRGNRAWAFIGLGQDESSAAADAALAYGLNWLDRLRAAPERAVISGIKLFLPEAAIPLNALRAGALNPRAAEVEIYEWPARGAAEPISPGSFANLETHLVPRRDPAAAIERRRDLLREILGPFFDRIDIAAEAGAGVLSLRVHGLEIARLEGQVAPRLVWGIEGNRRALRPDAGGSDRDEFLAFVGSALATRDHAARDPGHEMYRLQPERWLESLLIRDLSKLDPELRGDYVYPQVPAFSGVDRGVVDILSLSKDGRLAVIELKLYEDIALPFQGLDYWLRVKWLNDRRQFQAFGYFRGVELSPLPPRLYLISPAFRFHPSNERLIRYFDPSIEVIQAGLNQQWRQGVKVLFRRAFRDVTESGA
ncbi:MAG: hypothetical protein ACRD3D_02945 [Terriglobia bacterium]